MIERHRVVVLALDGVIPFELGIPSRVFGRAHDADGNPLYAVQTCTADGRPVRSDADFSVSVDHGPELLAEADTVVIPASYELGPAYDDVANQVARRCVVPPWRDGGQAQYIERPIPETTAESTAATRDWALDRLGESLTLNRMAAHSNMSVRTFTRRFGEEVGTTPNRWLITHRVDRARQLLETTDLSVDVIAREVGFGTAVSLRQHMGAVLGVPPSAYRRTFRGQALKTKAPA
ncbi:MAG: helix-turn-helix domain-containing protein [Rhodococcus sp. (in: high G+C Gram-positive bacteria)]|nr:MAG: helix-turn-helix domain-containing protein [Rhodococcus sp. (in: high G+C Gram-positive bacteria)]